jgi:hypothetical protein
LSSRDVFHRYLNRPRSDYQLLLDLLKRNRGLSTYNHVTASERRRRSTVALQVEGELDSGEDFSASKARDALVERVEKEVQDWVDDFNDKIQEGLEREYDDLTSDDQVVDTLNANDYYFDEEGNDVDKPGIFSAGQLKPDVQAMLFHEYRDLLNRTPQEVIRDLIARDLPFDRHGNLVDESEYKKVDDLDDDVREQVLDRHRNVNTDDSYWYEGVVDGYEEDLKYYGFVEPEVTFSLGEFAMFVANDIELETFLAKVLQDQEKRQQRERDRQLLRRP